MLRVATLVVVLLAITSQAAKPGLPVTKLGEGFYYVYRDQKNAFEAESYCRRFGMTLVSIESRRELDLIAAELTIMGYKTYDWWITSGSDNAREGTWSWTGTGRNLNFTSWGGGEPNNANNNENCLHMSLYNGALYWNDGNCNIRGRFICELPTTCWGY